MKASKFKLVPLLGLIGLVIFIALSYINNQILLNEILVCSAIFGMVLFVKMRGEVNRTQSLRQRNEYSDAA